MQAAMAGLALIPGRELLGHLPRPSQVRSAPDCRQEHWCDIPHLQMLLMTEFRDLRGCRLFDCEPGRQLGCSAGAGVAARAKGGLWEIVIFNVRARRGRPVARQAREFQIQVSAMREPCCLRESRRERRNRQRL
jgi:hypothetical protein